MADLMSACSSSTVGIYTIGGTQPPARIFHFLGAELTAVQSRAQSSLRYDEAPDLWAAEGDSLRLADGALMPKTVGELRTRYLAGLVLADRGDDSDGIRMRLCQLPGIEFLLPYSTSTPAESGMWSLQSKPIADTTRLLSIEVFPAKSEDQKWCEHVPAT
jgi:hypothetical protein